MTDCCQHKQVVWDMQQADKRGTRLDADTVKSQNALEEEVYELPSRPETQIFPSLLLPAL